MLFSRCVTLLACACLAVASTLPLQELSASPAFSVRSRLTKRTYPNIGEAIDINDENRGQRLVGKSGAFSHVVHMLNYAVADRSDKSPIFHPYFLEEHRDTVKGVMLKLLGKPSMIGMMKDLGADELGQFTF
ncbi:MAG: hypothetical protein Q9170_007441 [Blastenia crenularia]